MTTLASHPGQTARSGLGGGCKLGHVGKGVWGCGNGDVGMGMLNVAGQGWGWRDGDIEPGHSRDVGMGSLGGVKWKTGDTEPGRTGPVLGYFHPGKGSGISWWPEE